MPKLLEFLTDICFYVYVSTPFPCPVFPHQIENASEVLITPLEKFRKEQIGAAKVRIMQTLLLDFRAALFLDFI